MSQKSKTTTFLLCYFLGYLGVHRFYLNKVVTGLLMLVTFGGLTIWWLVDAVLIASGQMKDRDGDDLRSGPPDPENPHAGFWVRLAAMTVDSVVLQLLVSILLTTLAVVATFAGLDLMIDADSLVAMDPQALEMMVGTALAVVLLAILAVLPLYFGIQTASRHQATVGKRCFDIYVVDGDGGRPGLARAMWRSVCYLFSALPLYLGFVMAGFTRDKRALHDYMAGTRVLYVGEVAPVAALGPAVKHHEADATPEPSSGWTSGATSIEPVESTRTPTLMMVVGAVLLAAAAALALM